MPDCILAYDVGTSGCKTAVVTTGGQVIATAAAAYPTSYPRPHWAEQNVDDWWRAVALTTQQALASAAARPQEVLGLAFSTQMLNTIAIDGDGQPLRPCIHWLDSRAGAEANGVMRKLGGAAIFARVVGAELTGKDLLPKYLWLKRNEPDVYRRAVALVDASGFLLFRATGRLVAEWSVASVTGLFNLKSKTWDRTLIRLFGLDIDKFPPLVRSYDRVGGLTSRAATELGLLAGTPVFGGAGDAQAAAVGSGAVGEEEAHLCLGTSGFVGVVTSRRVTGKNGIATIQAADPDKLLLIAESETVGECLRWAAREIYGADPDSSILAQMDEDVARVAPGAGDLIFTSWLYGERCPVADPRVRAAFLNLGANHTRAQMARAVYEGVAYNMRWILDVIARLYGFPCESLRVLGGGAQGLPWLRIIADISGRRLESVAYPRATSALGAALIAAIGLGVQPSFAALKPLVAVTHTIAPDPGPQATYDRLYSAYRRVYPALKDLYHDLNQ